MKEKPLIAIYLVLAFNLSLPIFAADSGDLVLVGGQVYPAPYEKPIENAVVVIRNGKIEAVAKQSKILGTGSGRVLDCSRKVIVASFWNSQVHFETGWQDAAKQPAVQLETRMQDMLTRWGFTTAWDLGSQSDNTLALRRRIESGEVQGTRILMAPDIFPKNGHPVYLPAEMHVPEAPRRKKPSRWRSNMPRRVSKASSCSLALIWATGRS
jgi:hypothetical protein